MSQDQEPTTSEIAGAVNTANELSGVLGDLMSMLQAMKEQREADVQVVATVRDETRGNRRIIIGLVISFAIDIILTVAFVFLTISLINQDNNATATNKSQCIANNTARAQDKTLWDVFLSDLAPKGTKLTPKIQAELAHLNQIVAQKDAPRNCSALY
jgi:large-conductance mechanosensitive channel